MTTPAALQNPRENRTNPGGVAGPGGAWSAINVLLQHGRLVLAAPLIGFALALLLIQIRGFSYVADSTFVPHKSKPVGVSGLAASIGINLEALAPSNESIEFYSKLLKSRSVLEDLAQTGFRFRKGDPATGDSVSGTLVDLLGVSGRTPQKRLQRAVKLLDSRIFVSVDMRAEMVTVRTVAPWPALAAQINRRLIELLNDFNQRKRQSQARAEREFVEGRLQQAETELRSSEDEVENFLRHNRRYLDSPELTLVFNRLQRQVDLRQQVYATLAQSYEQARIDEVRNTPVITVVDNPEGSSVRKTSRLISGLVGMIVAVLAVLGYLLVRQWLTSLGAAYPTEMAVIRGRALEMVAPLTRRRRPRGTSQ